MYQKRKINPGECNYLNELMDHTIQKCTYLLVGGVKRQTFSAIWRNISTFHLFVCNVLLYI